MIRELIFSLSGNVGTFLEKEFSQYHDTEAISYFHPCEVNMVKELLQIASNYRKIKLFYDKYGHYHLDLPDSMEKGLYITALATATYNETKCYGTELISIDSEICADKQISISALLVRLQPYKYIFRRLNHLITMVVDKKIHGCKILDIVHFAARESVGNMGECLARIEQYVHEVFFNQIINWVLFGQLWDPHCELFIRLNPSLEQLNCKDKRKRIDIEVEPYFEMLPEHIPLSMAEKIIFIGESISFFEQEKHITDKQLSDGIEHAECLKELRSNLASKTFLLKTFSNEIEKVRQFMAENLYTLVMKSGLIQELDCFKNVYLLGRGELYQTFFNICGPLVVEGISSVTNINGLFRKSAQQLCLEGDFLEKFHWSIQKTEENSSQDDKGWDRLSVSYSPSWPLHKVFCQSIQQKYNDIMRFLFSIQLIQYRLQHAWVSQHKTESLNQAFPLRWTHSSLHVMSNLGHHMNLLIYNLQYYIQVDVIECQYMQLIRDIKECRDYPRMLISHNNFIASVTTRCFLNHSVLSSSIQNILEKMHQFCDLLSDTSEDVEAKIAELKQEFDLCSGKFFWILSTLGLQETSRHTAQIIMRLDYNKFYSQKSSAKRFLTHSTRES